MQDYKRRIEIKADEKKHYHSLLFDAIDHEIKDKEKFVV